MKKMYRQTKPNKYKTYWKLEGEEIVSLALTLVTVLFILFQIARSI